MKDRKIVFQQLKEFILGGMLSQGMVDWKESDRLSFLVIFICAELFFQFLWFSLIWLNEDIFSIWVNTQMLGWLWLLCSNVLLFFIWFFIYIRWNSEGDKSFKGLQILILLMYIFYMLITYVAMGLTNIFVGVTLVSVTLLGFFFMWGRLVWWVFSLHILGLLGLVILPLTLGLELPSLHQELPSGTSSSALLSRGAIFWILSNLFWSLPKAILSISVITQWFAGMDAKLEEANYVINYDDLTKVKNRRFIMQYLYDILFELAPNSLNNYNLDGKPQALSVIMLDVDHFKSINDTHGHLSGDMVLIDLAKRLNDSMSVEGWETSRYGGEEFLLVLPQVTHADAMQVAGQVHQALTATKYRIVDGILLKVTSSLGVASFSHDEVISMRKQYRQNRYNKLKSLMVDYPSASEISAIEPIVASQEDLIIESLVNMADSALYDAKGLGRNRIVSANQYIDEGNSRIYIEKNIKKSEIILSDVPTVRDIPYS